MLMVLTALSSGSNQSVADTLILNSGHADASRNTSATADLSALSHPSTATAAGEQVFVEPAQPSSSNQIIGVDSYDTVGRWGIVVLFAVALWMKLSGKQTKQSTAACEADYAVP